MLRRVRPWMWVAAIWLWPAGFNVIQRIIQVKLQGWDPPSARELFFTAGDWLIYAVVTPIIFAVAERWPITRPRLRRRVLVHLGFALLFCVVWATGGKLLDLVLISILEPAKLQQAINAAGDHLAAQTAINVTSWVLTTIPFGVVVFATVDGLAHAIRYFSDARDHEVQVARLSEQLTTARFSALQAQLNPHFLFNTLNTIAVRARDGDGAGTAQMVEELSDMLRRTLGSHRANQVTLDEELELARGYLSIEQARFSDRLRASFDIAEGIGAAAVPAFALQHMVENAIRHGIAKRAEAGRVGVSARRDGETLELLVTDDGPGITAARGSLAGHGLANTRERLRALHGDRASLVVEARKEGGTRAVIRVPYRELAVEADVGPR